MKLTNEFVKWLVKEENPFPTIFSFMKRNIWKYSKDIKEYYKQGQLMNSFERTLNDSYSELYTDLLPKYCMGTDFDIDLDEKKVILMDSMSIREGVLLNEKLKKQDFKTNMTFGFSSLPSETEYFRSKIGYNKIRRGRKTMKIQDSSQFILEGDEDIIWSVFPDSRLENIQSGRTVLSNTEEMYEEVEKIVLNVINQHEKDKFVITSDHGYAKSTGGYQFRADKKDMMKVRNIMSGSRYKKTEMNESLQKMIDLGFLIYYNKYSMARGRYTWPVSGKYDVYQHGGVSLMECMTPKIEVER